MKITTDKITTDDGARDIRGGWAPKGTPLPILSYPHWFVGTPLFAVTVYVAWTLLSGINPLYALTAGFGAGILVFIAAGAVTKAATNPDTPLLYWVQVLRAEASAPRPQRKPHHATYGLSRQIVKAAAVSDRERPTRKGLNDG